MLRWLLHRLIWWRWVKPNVTVTEVDVSSVAINHNTQPSMYIVPPGKQPPPMREMTLQEFLNEFGKPEP